MTTLVEVKDVELPELMRRAMARQAEAERERRAKGIHALGELEAPETLGQPPKSSRCIQLQCSSGVLSTMTEVTSDGKSILVFPLPTEVLRLVDTLE